MYKPNSTSARLKEHTGPATKGRSTVTLSVGAIGITDEGGRPTGHGGLSELIDHIRPTASGEGRAKGGCLCSIKHGCPRGKKGSKLRKREGELHATYLEAWVKHQGRTGKLLSPDRTARNPERRLRRRKGWCRGGNNLGVTRDLLRVNGRGGSREAAASQASTTS